MSSGVECPHCDRQFSTVKGQETHTGKVHRDIIRKQIKELYVNENLKSSEVAARIGSSTRTVSNYVTEFDLDGKDPANFHLELKYSPYPVWSGTGATGKGGRLRVHQLLAIADGADPHKVFSGNWDVDHINGCPIDNRPENLRLIEKGRHGAKDGKKSEFGHTHEEYLKALIQDPPEWVADVKDGD